MILQLMEQNRLKQYENINMNKFGGSVRTFSDKEYALVAESVSAFGC